jgi:hypothetical protein
MSSTVVVPVVLVVLVLVLFVLPAAVVLRDLRAGRRDPSWKEDTMM